MERNRTSLSPSQEKQFKTWYTKWASRAGINPDPDNPAQKYDYRAAFLAGVEPTIDPSDKKYHWPSEYKDPDHPNRFVGGVDTITNRPSGAIDMTGIVPRQTKLTDASLEEEALKDSPSRSRQLARQRLLAAGIMVPPIPDEPPSGSVEPGWFGRTAREVAIDTALFVGAGAIAGATATALGSTLPVWATALAGGGLFAAGKAVYEHATGEEQETLAETLSGQTFPPAARSVASTVEAAIFMGGGAEALRLAAKGTVLVGGSTGKVLKGVDYISSGALTKVGKAAEPYATDFLDFVTWVPRKIPIPGTGRNLQEVFQPGVERLAKSDVKQEVKAAASIRKSEVQKKLVNQNIATLGRETTDLSLKERLDVMKGLRNPRAKISERAQAVVESFDNRMVDANLDPLFEQHVRQALFKNINIPLEVEYGAMNILLDPKTKLVSFGKFTRKARKAMDDILSDPSINPRAAELIKDLYSFPVKLPRDVFEAARTAQTAFIKQKLVNNRGLVAQFQKAPHYVKSSFFKIGDDPAYVPRDVELQLKDMAKIEQLASSTGSKLMSMWKSGKTIMRPAYHGRNLFSNAILADWGGLPVYRVDVYFRAMKEMIQGSKRWNNFIHTTGGLGTFVQDDLVMLQNAARGSTSTLDMAYRVFRKLVHHPARIQNAEENWFKFAKYIHSTEERGLSHAEAILDAQKYLLNYSEASIGAAYLRRPLGVMPFGTWYTKIIPLAVDTAVHHPLRFSKWILFGMKVQNYAIDQVSLNEEEWEHIKDNMPHWMRNRLNLLLPSRDDQGRLKLFNATFLMPGIGDVYELYNLINWTSGGGLQIPNPIYSFMGSLATGTKSSGAPLFLGNELPSVKYAKAASYALEQFMPAVTPKYGVDWQMLSRAIHEEQGAPTVGEAMLSAIGLKVQPIDPRELARKKHALDELFKRDAEVQFKKEMNKAKTGEKKREIIERYRKTRLGMLPER